MTTGQIIAMGGGGFSMEPENPLLDRYVLTVVNKPRPRVLFLSTAAGDPLRYALRFYEAFAALGAVPAHLSLFEPPTADLEDFVCRHDAVYVGGGNTKCLLALWREWALDEILRRYWAAGGVLAGISAGAICWFEQGLTDSIPGALTALPCLGFLPGSCSPHYDGEADRRPSYQRLIADGSMPDGYAADDGAALHFVGTSLERVVTSCATAGAYQVRRTRTGATETALPTVDSNKGGPSALKPVR